MKVTNNNTSDTEDLKRIYIMRRYIKKHLTIFIQTQIKFELYNDFKKYLYIYILYF